MAPSRSKPSLLVDSGEFVEEVEGGAVLLGSVGAADPRLPTLPQEGAGATRPVFDNPHPAVHERVALPCSNPL